MIKRITVKADIYDKNIGKYLTVKSFPNFISWGMVGGGAKKNEQLKDAIFREIEEELGLDISGFIDSIEYKGIKDYRYGFYTNEVHLFSIVVTELPPISFSWEILDYKWVSMPVIKP